MKLYNSSTYQIREDTTFFINRAKELNKRFLTLDTTEDVTAIEREWYGSASMLLKAGQHNVSFIAALRDENESVWKTLENNVNLFNATL